MGDEISPQDTVCLQAASPPLASISPLTQKQKQETITIKMSNEDEARRKLLKPKVTAEEALSILIDCYIPDGFGTNPELPRCEVIDQLDSYDDINYLVKIDGQKALLKIHNGVESEQFIAAHVRKRARLDNDVDVATDAASKTSIIDMHTAIYEHLADPKYGLTTGRSIPTKNSPSSSSNDDDDDRHDSVCIRELSVISEEHSPAQLVVRLQTWVHGSPLSDIKWCSIETLVDAGCYLGKMSHALDDLAVTDKDALQASKHYHAWDGRNVVDIEPYISHLDDKSQRNLITSIITSFKKEIIESGEGEKFRMGINHADFNDANIIVGNEDGDGIKVTGVIDFGDTVYR